MQELKPQKQFMKKYSMFIMQNFGCARGCLFFDFEFRYCKTMDHLSRMPEYRRVEITQQLLHLFFFFHNDNKAGVEATDAQMLQKSKLLVIEIKAWEAWKRVNHF